MLFINFPGKTLYMRKEIISAILGLDLVYYSVARFVGFKPYLGDSFLALTHEALLCHLLRRLEKAKPRITEIICLTNMTT